MLTPMTQTPDSSQIAAYGYDAASRTLRVQFRRGGKGGKPEPRAYDYQDVPPEIAAGLDAAESKGSFVHNSLAKGKPFAFERIDLGEAVDAEPATA